MEFVILVMIMVLYFVKLANTMCISTFMGHDQ